MKKNSSKWLIVLIAVVMVMTACSKNKDSNPTSTGESTGTGKTTKLTAFSEQPARISSYNDNLLTQKIEKKLGIDIDFQTAPSEGAKDKQNLILASGDYPAAFIGGDFSKVDQLKYGALGVLVPLNDLIEEYGPNIKKAFVENPSLKAGITTPDGKIYALPGLDGCWHCYWPAKSWINEDWLKVLNMDMPTTTEEYEKVLLAMKNNDPNKNGKADEVPLSGYTSTGSDWGNPITFLMNAFVYTDPSNYLKLDNGKADLVADNEEWKQGLTYIKGLYDKGLIDQQAFTQNMEGLQKTAMNPDGVILGDFGDLWNGDIVTIYEEAVDQRWNQYVAVPPLKGPNGAQFSTYNGYRVPNGKFAITDKASKEQAIAAIKVADYLYTMEGALDNFQGVDGWVVPKEEQVGTNGKPALYTNPEGAATDWDAPTKTQWENGFYYMPIDLFHGRVSSQDMEVQEGNEVRLYNENLKYSGHEPAEDVRLPDIFINPDAAQSVAEMSTVINAYIKQNAVSFVIGQKDLNKDWDAYVKGIQDMDAAKYLKVYQDALDSYK
ncbi:ABC transporter substrate-binding protein [Paenibacillus psychroresistens]|uniref:ABC transporter substrate-binding protein n=1 Tax=Paenibacillus psychroresistens TaxID=1778678 RepID=A0A6B8RGA8_9BACL|nr:ABC transporter substrate-binding protein [Paenibacillus psychroresistens]QGQ95220.1 ABC transporter substrate-binding protein [Paenibacillus psychroresistens]